MIINDINYLEATNEEVFGGVSVDKDVSIDVDVDLDFNADIDLDVDKDIKANLDSDVDVSGNFAAAIVDLTAIGDNTFTELDLAITVTDGLSEVSAVGTAAVG